MSSLHGGARISPLGPGGSRSDGSLAMVEHPGVKLVREKTNNEFALRLIELEAGSQRREGTIRDGSMCILHDDARSPQRGAEGLHRRDVLTRLAALGLTVPLVTLGLGRSAMAGSISFLDRAELIDGLQALISKAQSPE